MDALHACSAKALDVYLFHKSQPYKTYNVETCQWTGFPSGFLSNQPRIQAASMEKLNQYTMAINLVEKCIAVLPPLETLYNPGTVDVYYSVENYRWEQREPDSFFTEQPRMQSSSSTLLGLVAKHVYLENRRTGPYIILSDKQLISSDTNTVVNRSINQSSTTVNQPARQTTEQHTTPSLKTEILSKIQNSVGIQQLAVCPSFVDSLLDAASNWLDTSTLEDAIVLYSAIQTTST